MNPISNPFVSNPNEPLMWSIFDYLRDELPGNCFDDGIDTPFVSELLTDFPELDILDQLKLFRWCRNNEPFSETSNQPVVLRRWIARAAHRHSEPLRSRPW